MTASLDDIRNQTQSVNAIKCAQYWKEHKKDDALTTQLVALAARLSACVPAARAGGVTQADVIRGAVLEFFQSRMQIQHEATLRALKAQQQVTVNAMRAALDEVAKKNTITP